MIWGHHDPDGRRKKKRLPSERDHAIRCIPFFAKRNKGMPLLPLVSGALCLQGLAPVGHAADYAGIR